MGIVLLEYLGMPLLENDHQTYISEGPLLMQMHSRILQCLAWYMCQGSAEIQKKQISAYQ